MPLLFSYGTLQEEAVQLSTFGRVLHGQPDQLIGFAQSVKTVEDPAFVAASGKAAHRIVTFTGKPDDRVGGVVFELTDDELAAADHYEPAGWERVKGTLLSGKRAWVYAGVGDLSIP